MDTSSPNKLKDLIFVLQQAELFAYHFEGQVPVDIILEATLDILIHLSSVLREGRKTRRNNKTIKFLENELDELANPKQISFRKTGRFYWNPEAENYISDFTSFLVRFKAQDENLLDFMSKDFSLWNQVPTKFPSAQSKKKDLQTYSQIKTDKTVQELVDARVSKAIRKLHAKNASRRRQGKKSPK